MRLARVLGAIGRTLITAGVLVLLFVVYQLWGTNIAAARSQNRLENEFEEKLAEALEGADTTTTTSSTTSTTSTTAVGPGSTAPSSTLPPSTVPPLAETEIPPQGDAAGRIEIPAINVDWIFVEGVRVSDLQKGPGHYPETPFPGQAGNSAIAGHRTTYGAPFNRVDELDVGDDIIVTTLQGRFTYGVVETTIVDPSQVEVLDPTDDNRLTLTSCEPKYSARKRIIIVATLEGEPVPGPPPTVPEAEDPEDKGGRSLDAGLSGESVSRWPAVWWGLLCAAIWFVAWLAGRRWRKWPAYIVGAPIFLVALYFFFENFSRLLPSNY